MSRHAYWLALLPWLTACPGLQHGNGREARERRHVDAFSAIDSDSKLDVLVEPSDDDRYEVRVQIDSNLMDNVRTRVWDDTLHVYVRGWIEHELPGPHVIVRIPHLSVASQSGSGRLDIQGFAEAEPIDLSLSGSGELRFDGSAPEIRADLEGSGDLVLRGDSERLSVSLDGSGLIDAEKLHSREADIDLDGSGEVRATVDGPVDISLEGSGDIELFGAAEIEHRTKSGSGSIRIH
jgi:hypothetical protein